MKALLETVRQRVVALPAHYTAFRVRRGKRGLVNEILTIQLVSAAIAGSLAVAGL